jgi:hypothetical protein
MEDETENIVVDIVKLAFRLLRHLRQQSSGSQDELEGGDSRRSILP